MKRMHLSFAPVWLTLSLAGLSAMTPARAASFNAIRNGSFTNGPSEWKVNPALGEWNFAPYSQANLNPPSDDFAGMLFYQSLDVSVPQGTVADFAANLDAYEPFEGRAITFIVEYVNHLGATNQWIPANPENTQLPALVTNRLVFSGGSVRLTKLIVRKNCPTTSGSYFADNIRLDLDAGTVNPQPRIQSLSTNGGLYGCSVSLLGTNFGAQTGPVLLGGSTNGIRVQAWTTTNVLVQVNDPAASGRFTLLTATGESEGDPYFEVLSPYFALRADSPSRLAMQGQEVFFVIYVDAFNGLSNAVVNLDIPAPPSGMQYRISPSQVTCPGPALLRIHTPPAGLGTNRIGIRGTRFLDGMTRRTDLTLEVSQASAVKFYVRDYENHDDEFGTPTTNLVLTRQLCKDIWWRFWDGTGRELSPAGSTFSSSDPDRLLMLNNYGDPIGRDFSNYRVPFISPRTLGAATLTVTAPDGFTGQLSVSNAYPTGEDDAFIIGLAVTPAVVGNETALPFSQQAVYHSGHAWGMSMGPPSGRPGFEPDPGWDGSGDFSVIYTNGLFIDTWSFTNCTTAAGGAPGIYYSEIKANSNGVNIAHVVASLLITNSGSRGMMTGRLIKAGPEDDDPLDRWCNGTMVFYDAAMPHTQRFEQEVRDERVGYFSWYIPPGNYIVRFLPDEQAYLPSWYGGDSRASVQINAGQVASNTDFVLVPRTYLPDLRIYVQDDTAIEETTNTASVMVAREGPVDYPLTVHYTVGGSAEIETDYQITGWDWKDGEVQIPEGQSNAFITITPVNDDNFQTGRTVRVILTNEYSWSPATYNIRHPSNAVVTIYGRDTQSWTGYLNSYFTPTETNIPAISGPGADPNGNGIPNLMEYALGRNPRAPDETPPFWLFSDALYMTPGKQADSSEPQGLYFIYERAKALTDVTCDVDLCPDLAAGNWYNGPGYLHTASVEDAGNGTTEVVRVQVDYSGPSAALRLRVNGTAP